MKYSSLLIGTLSLVLLGAGCAKTPAPATTTDTKTPAAVNTPAAAPLKEGLYGGNPEDSKITWSGKKRVLPAPHTGTVTMKEGEFFIKEGKPFIGEVVMDMSTITSDEKLDSLVTHLKSADFFDVANHPTATFRNKNTVVVDAAAGKYTLEGDLIIKGVTVPTSVPATFKMDATDPSAIRVTAEITVDRTLFGMKFGSGKFFDNLGDKLVEDNFTIKVDALFD